MLPPSFFSFFRSLRHESIKIIYSRAFINKRNYFILPLAYPLVSQLVDYYNDEGGDLKYRRDSKLAQNRHEVLFREYDDELQYGIHITTGIIRDMRA